MVLIFQRDDNDIRSFKGVMLNLEILPEVWDSFSKDYKTVIKKEKHCKNYWKFSKIAKIDKMLRKSWVFHLLHFINKTTINYSASNTGKIKFI